MNIKRAFRDISGIVAAGATVGLAGNLLDFDVTILEGARQTILAALPLYVFTNYTNKNPTNLGGQNEENEMARKHPYSTIALTTSITALTFLGGGCVIDAVIKEGINKVLVGSAGAIYGFFTGITTTYNEAPPRNVLEETTELKNRKEFQSL